MKSVFMVWVIWKVSEWSKKCLDDLKSVMMIQKVSGWYEKCFYDPSDLNSVQMIQKVSRWSEKYLYDMKSVFMVRMIWKVSKSKPLKGQLWPRVSDKKSSLSHAVSWRSVVTPRKHKKSSLSLAVSWRSVATPCKLRKIITFSCCHEGQLWPCMDEKNDHF